MNTMNVDMTMEEYVFWRKLKKLKKTLDDDEYMDLIKVKASIKDPAVIAKIKFLFEKKNAANYGAEQMFDKARSHQEDIWLTIKAELPEHFKDVEEYNEEGVLAIDHGKTYNHELNVLHYVKAVKKIKGKNVDSNAPTMPVGDDDSTSTAVTLDLNYGTSDQEEDKSKKEEDKSKKED